MRDSYLYDNSSVLINKLGIKDIFVNITYEKLLHKVKATK